MTVTMEDVAKYANVSKMTVSRVLNNSKHVSEELSQLVNHAIIELGYQPNSSAQALARKKSTNIQMHISKEITEIVDYFEFLNGVSSAFAKAKLTFLVNNQVGLDLARHVNFFELGFSDNVIDYEHCKLAISTNEFKKIQSMLVEKQDTLCFNLNNKDLELLLKRILSVKTFKGIEAYNLGALLGEAMLFIWDNEECCYE